MPILAWNVPLIYPVFLKGPLVFPILLFSSFFFFFLQCSLKKSLSLLAILWNSAFSWIHLSLSPLPFFFLLSSTICIASSDNNFAFLYYSLLYNVMDLHEQYEKAKRYDTGRWAPQVKGVQYATGKVVVVQSQSLVQLFATPWIVARQASLSFIIFQSLLKLMSTHSVSDAIQPSYPLLPHSPSALNLSHNQGLCQWVSSCIW